MSCIPQYSHPETTHPPSLNIHTLPTPRKMSHSGLEESKIANLKVNELICNVTLLFWKSLHPNTH